MMMIVEGKVSAGWALRKAQPPNSAGFAAVHSATLPNMVIMKHIRIIVYHRKTIITHELRYIRFKSQVNK